MSNKIGDEGRPRSGRGLVGICPLKNDISFSIASTSRTGGWSFNLTAMARASIFECE